MNVSSCAIQFEFASLFPSILNVVQLELPIMRKFDGEVFIERPIGLEIEILGQGDLQTSPRKISSPLRDF